MTGAVLIEGTYNKKTLGHRADLEGNPLKDAVGPSYPPPPGTSAAPVIPAAPGIPAAPVIPAAPRHTRRPPSYPPPPVFPAAPRLSRESGNPEMFSSRKVIPRSNTWYRSKPRMKGEKGGRGPEGEMLGNRPAVPYTLARIHRWTPVDTDGRREDSGRGVRKLQAR